MGSERFSFYGGGCCNTAFNAAGSDENDEKTLKAIIRLPSARARLKRTGKLIKRMILYIKLRKEAPEEEGGRGGVME